MELYMHQWPLITSFATALIVAWLTVWRASSRRSHQPSSPQPQATTVRVVESVEETECQRYKDLYFKLHNLENHGDVLPEAKTFLLSFFSAALQHESTAEDSILTLSNFSSESLDSFVHAELRTVTKQWREYLSRREQGHGRELFPDAGAARRWLVSRAPLKLVDGAWLGNIHTITTPFAYRRVTKAAWQVLSEELGDGDVTKCHVHLYAKLLDGIGALPPHPDTEQFIKHSGMNDMTVWRSAVAQMLICLYPNDFLAEALGFNLNFEMMTFETLLAAKELQEVGIDPSYFTLHITIDNADTGHTAMSSRIVADFLHLVLAQHGDAAAQRAWRRVQTGYLLSKNVHKISDLGMNTEVAEIFLAKAIAADGLHDHCPVKIGGQRLSTWLNPASFRQKDWQTSFLRYLVNAKPWVFRGDSRRSRLIRLISSGGRMFGAFTDREVSIIRHWIDAPTGPGPDAYNAFIGKAVESESWRSGKMPRDRSAVGFFTVLNEVGRPQHLDASVEELTTVDMSKANFQKLLPLWFTHTCLLESVVSVPWLVANDCGCAVVRLLRAQRGSLPEPSTVHGSDEMNRANDIDLVSIGIEMLSRANLGWSLPKDLDEVLGMWPSEFAEMMLAAAKRPRELKWVLLGMTQAFTKLHTAITASPSLLSKSSREALKVIAEREQESLTFCIESAGLEEGANVDFAMGYSLGLREIGACMDS